MAPRADAPLFRLLADLWLHEPDTRQVQALREAASRWGILLEWDGAAQELAPAYADLILLNVPPYGTAYTDAWAEINTAEAQQVGTLFAAHGYEPEALRAVGAPDHLGLCLGFLAGHGDAADDRVTAFGGALLSWAPVCCFAVERDPSVNPFYAALARLTRNALFARVAGAGDGVPPLTRPEAAQVPEGEVRLRDVVRFLLVPARCGLFLSRAHLGAFALALEMRLPFGPRFEVAQWLFTAAGEGGRVRSLLDLLDAEAGAWQDAYREWVGVAPHWQPYAAQWLERAAQTRRRLAAMHQQARDGVPVELLDPADIAQSSTGLPPDLLE